MTPGCHRLSSILAASLAFAAAQPALAQADGASDLITWSSDAAVTDIGTDGPRGFDGRLSRQAPLEGAGWRLVDHAGYASEDGLYLQLSSARLSRSRFKASRAFAFHPQSLGRSRRKGWAASGEIGREFRIGGVSATPFAALDYVDAKLDGYVEAGEASADPTFRDRDISTLTASLGGELAADIGPLRPALRGGYSIQRASDDGGSDARLRRGRGNGPFAELRLGLGSGPVAGFVSGGARWIDGDDDARVAMGMRCTF